MGREVRRVPADWQHPKAPYLYGREGEDYVPLFDGFNKALADWLEGQAKWAEGLRDDYRGGWISIENEHKSSTWEDWSGERPDPKHYMPDFPAEERTHWQMYQNTSEGTPISPVIETPEELARWLADNEASAFANQTASYEDWLSTIMRGSAPSAVISDSAVTSGVAAMPGFPKEELTNPDTGEREVTEYIDQGGLTDAAQGLFEIPRPFDLAAEACFIDAVAGAKVAHIANFGHPWTQEAGWDLLELREDTEEQLTKRIADYEKEFWQVWIRDNTGRCGAVLYKPSDAAGPWEDPIRKSKDNG
jgi:hypothetical protein